MMISLAPVLAFALPLFAHQASAAALDVAAGGDGEVLFTPRIVDRGTHCIVGFAVTYPRDVVPHGRHIRVTTIWSETSQDGIWPIPPHGAPASFVHNDDGTVTYSGGVNESVGVCDPELTARTLAIGPCAEGKCPPARFAPEGAAARLGLHETEY